MGLLIMDSSGRERRENSISMISLQISKLDHSSEDSESEIEKEISRR